MCRLGLEIFRVHALAGFSHELGMMRKKVEQAFAGLYRVEDVLVNRRLGCQRDCWIHIYIHIYSGVRCGSSCGCLGGHKTNDWHIEP